MKKFNKENFEQDLSKCSRCKEQMIKCICNKSHPSHVLSDLYRTLPIGNPDLYMDKGNRNYMKINNELLKGILG